MESWVITIQGPVGVKHIEVPDQAVQDYRVSWRLDREIYTDYQLAMFIAYDREFPNG